MALVMRGPENSVFTVIAGERRWSVVERKKVIAS